MMTRMLGAVMLCLAVGCGPNFTGTFSGPVSTNVVCPSGQGGSNTNPETVTISESGSTLTILEGDACSPLTATQSGSTATIEPKTCPPAAANGITQNISFTGGTLTLSGNVLGLTISASDVLTNASGASETCTASVGGSLTRQSQQ